MSQPRMEGLPGIERDALTWGIKKLFNHTVNRVEWNVSCACGESESHPFNSNTSPPYMIRKFKQHGWTLAEKRRPVCAACREAERKAKVKKEDPMPAIGPDLKLTRRVMALLNEHFSEATHRYKDGLSDAAIANMVGCAADMVAHVRVDAGYGELADDPVLAELRSELDTLKDSVAGEMEGLREETHAALTSAVDRFKNEVLTLKLKSDQDIQAALTIFNERYASIVGRLDPLTRKAS